MSGEATRRSIPFGTAAAVFSSLAAAEAAAAALVGQGYPRELIAVLTGTPWKEGAAAQTTGYLPDPELRFQLIPTATAGGLATNPALASFIGQRLGQPTQRRNPAFWPLITLVLGIVVTLLALYSRNWITVTVIGLIALHIVAGVAVWAYTRNFEITFPFREEIPAVEERLEQGGALVTVNCTLPYRRPVQQLLAEHGGEVIGYAPEIVYPVSASAG